MCLCSFIGLRAPPARCRVLAVRHGGQGLVVQQGRGLPGGVMTEEAEGRTRDRWSPGPG